MGHPSRDFVEFYGTLMDRFRSSGEDLSRFSPYEQETIALYCFNDDYGADGLPAYFAWHGRDLLDLTLCGLARIGAERLRVIVKEYADLLEQYGFRYGDQDVYDSLGSLPVATQAHFDPLQAEAADLYDDFYQRWEQSFDSQSRP